MFGLGTGELIMLVLVVVIVFSASRMSTLGNAMGRFVHSFKKASQGDGFVDVKPVARVEKTIDGKVISNQPPKH